MSRWIVGRLGRVVVAATARGGRAAGGGGSGSGGGGSARLHSRMHSSTQQQGTNIREVAAYGSLLGGGAAVLYVLTCGRAEAAAEPQVQGLDLDLGVPPIVAASDNYGAMGSLGPVSISDLITCSSSERGNMDYISDDDLGWGGSEGGASRASQESGSSGEKKDSKVVNLEQEMLKRRKIIIYGPIDDRLAYNVCMKILYLESEDPGKPIEMLINSPGGKVAAGLAIYDWMQLVSSPIHTVCWGRAFSMGAVLLAAGEKGQRMILPNAKVMIHQPSVEIPRSVASDIMIKNKEMQDTKTQLKAILAKHMGVKEEWIEQASERDYYMKPDEAIQCGIVDRIVTSIGPPKL